MRFSLRAAVVKSYERKGVRRYEEAHNVVDHGADVGADDVVRERGGVRGQRTRGMREGQGHHSLSRVRKEREPTEVPADDDQEGQRQLFTRGTDDLQHALSSGPVQGLVSRSSAQEEGSGHRCSGPSIYPYSAKCLEGAFCELRG